MLAGLPWWWWAAELDAQTGELTRSKNSMSCFGRVVSDTVLSMGRVLAGALMAVFSDFLACFPSICTEHHKLAPVLEDWTLEISVAGLHLELRAVLLSPAGVGELVPPAEV